MPALARPSRTAATTSGTPVGFAGSTGARSTIACASSGLPSCAAARLTNSIVRSVARSFSPVMRTNFTSGRARSAICLRPSGLPLAVMTTISLAENTTYHVAPSRSLPATFLPIRSCSTTAGDDGAKTSQVSPLMIRPARSRETPEMRLIVTPACCASNAFLSSRIGPASESAWKTSSAAAAAGVGEITAMAISGSRSATRRCIGLPLEARRAACARRSYLRPATRGIERTRKHADDVDAPRGPRHRRSGAGSSCRRRRSASQRPPRARPGEATARPSASTRRSARPRSRSCRPCRSSSIRRRRRRAPGRDAARRAPASIASNAFWWQWPCNSARFSGSATSGSRRRPARCSRARNSSISSARSDRRCAASPSPSTRNSSRSVSRHDGSRPTTQAPRSTCGASAATIRRASRFASSTIPAARYVRPQHSGRVRSASSARGRAIATR